jgi:hypothetical protein
MAELLVYTVDKTNPTDAVMDAALPKCGNVVVICDDGWPWSDFERSAAEFAILQVPGVDKADLSGLTAGGVAHKVGDRMLTYRAFRLNASALEGLLGSRLDQPGTRALEVSLATLLELREPVPKPADPDVLALED